LVRKALKLLNLVTGRSILSKKDSIYKFLLYNPSKSPFEKGDLSPPFSKEGLGGL